MAVAATRSAHVLAAASSRARPLAASRPPMVPPIAPAPMTMYRIAPILSVRSQRRAGRGDLHGRPAEVVPGLSTRDHRMASRRPVGMGRDWAKMQR